MMNPLEMKNKLSSRAKTLIQFIHNEDYGNKVTVFNDKRFNDDVSAFIQEIQEMHMEDVRADAQQALWDELRSCAEDYGVDNS